MRSLATTALTLAFIVMAAITYVALEGDPMGGEPRLLVKIAPPDAGKQQSSSAPAPAVDKPALETAAAPPPAAPKITNLQATDTASQPATLTTVSGVAPTGRPLEPVSVAGGVTSPAAAMPATTSADSEADTDFAGVGLAIPK